MKWKGRRQSENVVDAGTPQQGARPRAKTAAMGGGLGLIALVVITLLSGGDLSSILGLLTNQATGGGLGGGLGGGGTTQAQQPSVPYTAAENELLAFVKTVLADTEDVWNTLFRAEYRKDYPEPTLVHFRDGVDSACGFQSKAVGPFYCSGDNSIFVDLSFFRELAKRHSAAGDFAQAYVIAHEVGHHIQNVTGISQKVHMQKRGRSEVEQNRLSVRQELHADFLAGVWAHHAQAQKQILDPGDIQEALNAAKQIGDDTLQRKARGSVQPDGFTHGTAEQRQRWFAMGFDTGEVDVGLRVYEIAYGDL